MYPTLIDLALGEEMRLVINSYRFFGVLAACYLAVAAFRHLRQADLSVRRSVIAIALAVISFFAGSRLLFVVLYWAKIAEEPGILFRFHLSNFTLYGGLALSLLAWWLITRSLSLPLFKLTDRLAPHLGISIAIMRIGCFLNGCCFGKVTATPPGINFPPFSPPHLAQITTASRISFFFPAAVHPTQLYELTAALSAALAAWIILSTRKRDGLAAAVFGLVFTTGRLITFYFREFPAATDLSNLIRGPVVYGIALVIFAAWIIHARREDNIQTMEEAK